MKRRALILVTLVLITLIACDKNNNKHKKVWETYVVKAEPIHKSLAFIGSIQPIYESALISPVDAIIETMPYHYGQLVKKDAVVLVLNSNALQKQYNDSLADYLRSKNNYLLAKTKFAGTKDLWQAGLLSKNNYLSEKSSFDTTRMGFMQATTKLQEMLAKTDENSNDLSSLSFSEFTKIRQALTKDHHSIHLKAPLRGILLYPPKSNDNTVIKLKAGALVKANQVIGLIGDLSGIRVEIDIPEIDIDKIHAGMPAIVTGVAFGQLRLNGNVVAVNAEATDNGNGALPSFSAVIEVKALSKEQQAIVKVGMSASIIINIDTSNQLLIPIAAVNLEQGKETVKLKKANGSFSYKIVATGEALADKVVITTGLKSGDVVAYAR